MPRRPTSPPLISPRQLLAAMAGLGLTRGTLADAIGIDRRSVIHFVQGTVGFSGWVPTAVRFLASRGVHFGPHDAVSFDRNAFGRSAIPVPTEADARTALASTGGRPRLVGTITPAELKAALDRIRMTQRELADLVGASVTSVSLFLRGRRGGALWLARATRLITERESTARSRPA